MPETLRDDEEVSIFLLSDTDDSESDHDSDFEVVVDATPPVPVVRVSTKVSDFFKPVDKSTGEPLKLTASGKGVNTSFLAVSE